MTTISSAHGKVQRGDLPQNLDDLALMSRWVAWREEARRNQDGTEYMTKLPYDPHCNGRAEVPTNPNTWGTRAQAKRRWQKLDNGRRGGVGIVLGSLGNGHHLLGLDLDRCIEKQTETAVMLDPFADKILERFDTYAEISPSGKGIKLFFLVATGDMEEVTQMLDGKKRRTFAAGKHKEIAIDRARFYAVTGDKLKGSVSLRVVDVSDVRWFVEDAGPEFQRLHHPAGAHIRDQSGSGFGFRFFASCKKQGKTFEQAWDAIQADQGKAGEWARRVDIRQLKRTWLNAPVKMFDDARPKQQAKISTITAYKLNDMEFPKLEFVVPDLIVEGLTLFAGRPKIGKSWLALQVANAVANGSTTLGGIRCREGDVLYCALEDNARRIQARMDQLKIADWSKRLHFCFDLPRLDEGGLDFLRAWIAAREKPRLIIIDTFKRVRPLRGESETLYDADYHSGQKLADLCRRHRVAVVIVHHDRKADADDPFDTISGSLGLNAVVDTVMLLRTENGSPALRARGRDLAEIAKAMTFDKSTCHWKIVGDVAQVRMTNERNKIAQAMEEIGHPTKLKEIADEAGLKPGNVSKLLRKMARDNVVFQHGYGKYGLEPSPERENSDD